MRNIPYLLFFFYFTNQGFLLSQNTDYSFFILETRETVLFDFDKYKLSYQSDSVLSKLVTLCKGNPSAKIHIEAHADQVGSHAYNFRLSKKRAKAVSQYFESRGIADHRIDF